jgi:signal transduction histidine kinase
VEAVRARLSRDIHDEIGAGLTRIKLMGRGLARAATAGGEWKEASEKITSASDELIQSLGEIVWTVNPDNDSLENVVAFIRNYLSRLFDTQPGPALRLDLPEPDAIPPGVTLHPEAKRNLLLILKEAVTNALRLARAA